jgi:hypothetical protein
MYILEIYFYHMDCCQYIYIYIANWCQYAWYEFMDLTDNGPFVGGKK